MARGASDERQLRTQRTVVRPRLHTHDRHAERLGPNEDLRNHDATRLAIDAGVVDEKLARRVPREPVLDAHHRKSEFCPAQRTRKGVHPPKCVYSLTSSPRLA